jgi:hypothetical protein
MQAPRVLEQIQRTFRLPGRKAVILEQNGGPVKGVVRRIYSGGDAGIKFAGTKMR